MTTSKVIDLYTAADIKKVKEILYKEQQKRCAISKQLFDIKDFHTDHGHDSNQYVRGVLYKQSNMMLGKIENLYARYLKFWYNGTLPEFLRQCADYLEDTERQIPRWRHPGWMKYCKTQFNKLNAKQQDEVLVALGETKGKNPAERKIKFSKLVLSRNTGFIKIMETIKKGS